MKSAAFLLFLVLLTGIAPAQQPSTVTISGRVLDDSSGTPLVNADVFIANTTLGAPTNEEGKFVIRNVPLGTHELVASRVGFALGIQSVRITDSLGRKIEFRLKPRALVVGAVEVVAPEPVEWKKDLEKFKDYFIGDGPNASSTILLNPEVLSFSKDIAGQFEAYASQPLKIENRSLGYRLELELVTFLISERWLTYAWKAHYREFPSTSADEEKEWAAKRLKTYKGSLRHFLASLTVGTASEQGFQMTRVKKPESRIRWPMMNDDLITPGELPNERILTFDDYLEVEYLYGVQRTVQRGSNAQFNSTSVISWLQLSFGHATINALGNYNEPFDFKVTGSWSTARIADELPFDYMPQR